MRKVREYTDPLTGEVSYTGFDNLHRDDDPLWSTDEVQSLLKRRAKRSESQEKEAKSRSNKKFYQNKVKSFRDFKANTLAKVGNGEITMAEAQKRIEKERMKLDLGWYRTHSRAKRNEAELECAKQALENAKRSGNIDVIKAAEEQLTQTISEQAQNAEFLDRIIYNLSALFKPPERLDKDGNPILPYVLDNNGEPVIRDRQPVVKYILGDDGEPVKDKAGNPIVDDYHIVVPPTWSNPSKTDYLTILALCLPMGLWSDNPCDSTLINKVRSSLSADKKYTNHNTLGVWVTEKEKADIFSTFNVACGQVLPWWSKASDAEKVAFQQEWLEERERVQKTFRSTSETHAPLIFHRIVEHAIRMTEIEEDSDDEGE